MPLGLSGQGPNALPLGGAGPPAARQHALAFAPQSDPVNDAVAIEIKAAEQGLPPLSL